MPFTRYTLRLLWLALLLLSSLAQAGTWQPVSADTGPANTWHKLCAAPGPAGTWHKLQPCFTGTRITIAASLANYNLYTALGSPSLPANVILTINAGVTVYSNTTSIAAFSTGSLPAGSTVKIVNNGYIIGAGGAGGYGGTLSVGSGGPGAPGGPALAIAVPVTLDNTGGYILGGGGGGGGGGRQNGMIGEGGGGGGGAGMVGGAGGPAWPAPGFSVYPGSPGSTVGGAGGTSNDGGGTGGYGGGYGAAGAAGQTTSGVYGAGGAGGAGGNAIQLNGNTVTWLGGYNGTQVQGAVN